MTEFVHRWRGIYPRARRRAWSLACKDAQTSLALKMLTGPLEQLGACICIFKIYCPRPWHNQPSTLCLLRDLTSACVLSWTRAGSPQSDESRGSGAQCSPEHTAWPLARHESPLFLTFAAVYTVFCRSIFVRVDEITSTESL